MFSNYFVFIMSRIIDKDLCDTKFIYLIILLIYVQRGKKVERERGENIWINNIKDINV